MTTLKRWIFSFVFTVLSFKKSLNTNHELSLRIIILDLSLESQVEALKVLESCNADVRSGS